MNPGLKTFLTRTRIAIVGIITIAISFVVVETLLSDESLLNWEQWGKGAAVAAAPALIEYLTWVRRTYGTVVERTTETTTVVTETAITGGPTPPA